MAYDGLFTKKMVESLQFLTTGRVHKINQPDNDTILMVVHLKIDKTINCYCQSIQTFQRYN